MNTIAASEDSWNYECKSRITRPLGRLGGSKRDHCVPKKDTAQPKAAINGMKYATKVKNIN